MINQQECEKLKEAKSDGFEWVAKDMSGGVFAYKTKPEKYSYSWIDDNNYRIISSRGSELEVLRWGDEEPYSIQELIEEYEYSSDHVSHVLNERVKALGNAWKESEETEVKKDKEGLIKYLKKEIGNFNPGQMIYDYLTFILKQLKQLEEPEVLSQEWIDGNKTTYIRIKDDAYYVPVYKLQNLIVPKQEEMKVPKMWHDVIVQNKENGHSLKWTLNYIDNLNANDVDSFARAWIAYPNIEVEEEQKYYLKIGNLYLAEPLGDMTSDIVRMTRDKEVAYQFTDEKSIAAHLDKFEGTEAVKVVEMEESD